MTSVWKTKVLPGLAKIFDKDGKKAAAAEFLKSFNKVYMGGGVFVISVYMFVLACLLIVWACYVYIYVGGY